MPVINKPGGGGGVALAYVQKKAAILFPYRLLPPPSSHQPHRPDRTELQERHPIAMLINDYGAFAVPKDSPYHP
jgi:putative tricarboxylic transport membrane protein